MYGLFSYSFEHDGMTFALVQSGNAYELRINGFPFNYLVELNRNKELFSKKEHHTTSSFSKVTSNYSTNESTQKVYIKPLFDFKIKPTVKAEMSAPKTTTKAFTFEDVSHLTNQPSENLIDMPKPKRDSFPTINEIFENNNKTELVGNENKINENFKRSASLNTPKGEDKAQILINSLNDIFVNKDSNSNVNNNNAHMMEDIFRSEKQHDMGQYPELGKVNLPNINNRERVASDLFN
jgi:hypothetical protein